MATLALRKELDTILAKGVDSFISSQADKMNDLLARTGENFVLFGAGRLGRAAITGLRKAGVEPLAFADNSSKLWGQTIDGIKVYSPQEAKEVFGNKALFVITVYTSTPVRRQLEELGVTFISFAELSWKYPQALLPHYATDLPHSIFSQAESVSKAFEIWQDEISQREFLAQITWRVSLNPKVLPKSLHPQEMYFQKDLFSILPGDVLVDCGSFDGDTIRELRNQEIDYRQLFAIEPDPINYQNLTSFISTLPENLRDKISTCNNAVGASREHVHFEATGTAGTTMDTGSYEVESIPLDELLANAQPTYIKMDIEGAEYQALLGGRKTIEKYRPILAICLYHHQEDLWRIPLLIQTMSDKYHLYLRRYSDECWEQVCYAIPKERVVK